MPDFIQIGRDTDSRDSFFFLRSTYGIACFFARKPVALRILLSRRLLIAGQHNTGNFVFDLIYWITLDFSYSICQAGFSSMETEDAKFRPFNIDSLSSFYRRDDSILLRDNKIVYKRRHLNKKLRADGNVRWPDIRRSW